MSIEYEYQVTEYDKDKLLVKMKDNEFVFVGIYIFKVQTFYHPLMSEKNTYIRVRDEGTKVTMTTKKKGKNGFDKEYEITVNNFKDACQLAESLGCIKKYYYEKIREIWRNSIAEVVFDTGPGIPECLEIETKTEKNLNYMIKTLELKPVIGRQNIYKTLFDVVIPSDMNLEFSTVYDMLLPLVSKNKSLFKKICEQNIAKMKSLKKVKKK